MRGSRWLLRGSPVLFALWLAGCGEESGEVAAGDGGGPPATDGGTPPGGDGAVPGPDLGPRPPGDAAPGDAAPAPDMEVVLHPLTELTVDGRVTVGFVGAPGARVQVVARCGAETVEVTTDDDGRYRLTVDVQGCNRLLVEFRKESFLPILRSIPLPPPTSPVTLNVAVAELKELICGQARCTTENDQRINIRPDPVARGWVGTFGGAQALPYVGGEFRDTDGGVLFVPAFGYFDLRDRSGRTIETLDPPHDACIGVEFDSYDQLADVGPGPRIEMPAYTLDAETGRWRRDLEPGYVATTVDYTEEGHPIIGPLEEARLGDARAGLVLTGLWICGKLRGSGWFAYGIPIARSGCLRVEVRDQCGQAAPNAVFQVTGRDYAYQAETWTDRRGAACLEAAASEAVGEDLNHNGVGGETLWLDLTVRAFGSNHPLPAQAMPTQDGTCRVPDSCTPFAVEANDFSRVECP